VLVVTDVSELRQARDSLNRLNEGLESTVRARTQELREANRGLRNEVVRRKAAEAALRASSSERSLLSEQLIVAQENERHRIARELHDGVGQSLSAVKYSIEQAIEVLRRSDLEDALPVLRRAVRGTRDAAENIRAIATSLRPPVLDDMGAVSAVRGFLLQFADIYRDIQFDLQISATDDDVPDRLATALFRSAQEMLSNVVKHASAKRVGLTLVRQPLLLTLEVRDDGVGIPEGESAEPGSPGHGIRNLRERAELTGGHFELLSGEAGGTVARTSWPLLHDEVSRKEAP
jgi:signal transduction histidine kinase